MFSESLIVFRSGRYSLSDRQDAPLSLDWTFKDEMGLISAINFINGVSVMLKILVFNLRRHKGWLSKHEDVSRGVFLHRYVIVLGCREVLVVHGQTSRVTISTHLAEEVVEVIDGLLLSERFGRRLTSSLVSLTAYFSSFLSRSS